mgnify:CR=1 FL=1|jgi:nitrogen fixation NifU-like protein
MSDDLRDLYQEVILDHAKNPRNYGAPENGGEGQCRHARGNNPLCGDRLTLHVTVADGVVRDARFEGDGCAISMASASLMTEAVKGRPEAEVRDLFHRFHELMTIEDSEADPDALDKLAVFSGVREFPVRVKCATLAWHTLIAALDGDDDATTEA